MTVETPSHGLTPEQFRLVSAIAHAEAGLVLVESKASMIAARLTKRLKSLKLPSMDAYFELLQSSQSREEMPNLLSALTTNVSHFFREEHHFEMFRTEVIPRLQDRAQSGERVRVWSAGCSSGQEIYSVAMILFENFPTFFQYDFRLLGTDIDPFILQTAKDGEYNQSQVKGLSEERLSRFFEPKRDGSGFQILPRVKSTIAFRQLNLINEWPIKHCFDVIFCRNVVIYFDEKTQENLWPRFSRLLKPSGLLFVGHSERVQNPASCDLVSSGITTYKKVSNIAPSPKIDHQDDKKWH